MIDYDEQGIGRDESGQPVVLPEHLLITGVVLKIAAPCNLNCGYCYVYNHEDQLWRTRPKRISDEVFDAFLASASEYCQRRRHKLSITFHGGEPTLVGPERLDQLAQRARAVLGDFLGGLSMQTNATLLDERWAEVIERNQIGLGISLDGPAQVHDAERVYHDGRGSHADTVAGLRKMQELGLRPYILSVLNPQLGGRATYEYFRELGIEHFDLLLPDVSHDNKQRFYGGLAETPVADALIEVLDAWLAEDNPAVKLRTLEDLVRGTLGGSRLTDAFGNAPMGYLIVETDGAIEALDALRVCGQGVGSSGLDVMNNRLDEIYTDSLPAVREIYHGMPLCSECRNCPEVKICGGGYLPHRYSRARGFDNPSVWCSDIKRVLAYLREVIGNQVQPSGEGSNGG